MILSKKVINEYLKSNKININISKIKELKKSRNFCFLVFSKSSKILFVKQIKSNNSKLIKEFKRELSFYENCSLKKPVSYLCFPALIDKARNVLILDSESSLRNLSYSKLIEDKFIQSATKIILDFKNKSSLEFEFLQKTTSLRIFELRSFLTFTKTENLFKCLVDFPNLEINLEACISLWKPESLMHGDIKLENFLINADKEIKLIDFESISIGDWYWDIACLIQSLIFDYYLEIENLLFLYSSVSVFNSTKVSEKIFLITNELGNVTAYNKTKLIKFTAAAIINKIIEVEFDKKTSIQNSNYFIRLSDLLLRETKDFENYFFYNYATK